MKYILAIVLATFFLATGCNMNTVKGSSTIVIRDLDYKDFENIAIRSMFEVVIMEAREFSVRLECNENIEEYVTISKEGQTLKLALKGNTSYRNVRCIAYISMPNIENIESKGAAEINLIDYQTEDLTVDLFGASKLSGNIIVNNLIVKTAGTSKIVLGGRASNGTFSISGATKIDSENLIFNNLNIKCYGASSVVAHVKENLDVQLNGACKLSYLGNPKNIKKEINGVGKINKID